MLLGSWAFAPRDLVAWQDLGMLFQRCLILDRASSACTKSLTSVMTQGVLCKPPREHSVQGWLWRKPVQGCIPRPEGRSLWQWVPTSSSLENPSHWHIAMPWLLSRTTLQHLSQGKFVQSLKGHGELCKSSSPDCFCWSVAACIVHPGINVMNVVLTSALCVPCTKYCLLESK